MTNPTAPLPLPAWMRTKELEQIFHALGTDADTTRFVGGCVRDMLLEVECYDIDIATIHEPAQAMNLLEASGIATHPTGIDFGTITAVCNQKTFEITTLRSDVDCDGRHAEVAFTTDWRVDAERRDFTINAMSLSFDGVLYDYFDGKNDLAKRHVRFVGEATARVQEDYLRILRFFRFVARFGCADAIDPAALAACVKYRQRLHDLAGERIQAECLKILISNAPHFALLLMKENGFFSNIVLPDTSLSLLENLVQIEQQLQLPPHAIRRLASLFITLNSDARLAALKQLHLRWKSPGTLQKQLHHLLSIPSASYGDPIEQWPARVYRFGTEALMDRLLLSAASSERPNLTHLAATLSHIQSLAIPAFPLSGKILARWGIAKGKMMGTILKAAEQKWLDSGCTLSENDLRSWIEDMYQ